MLALVLALILLASLPSPVLSPAATVTHWWRRVGEHGARPADPAGDRSTRAAFRMFGVLAPVAGVAAVAYVVVRSGWIGPHPPLSVLLGVAVAFGAVVSFLTGRWLRLRTQAPMPDKHGELRPWKTRAVNHPAGVSAGWSVVYGLLYALLALGTFAWAPQQPSNLWTGLAVGSAVIAVVLCTVAPFWFPVRARRELNRRISTDGDLLARLGAPAVTANEAKRALRDSLIRSAATYAYLTGVVDEGRMLVLSPAGRGPRRRPPRPGPVPADVTTGHRAPHRGRPDDAVRGCGPGARHRHRHRVAVAMVGLAVALVAGWFEGKGAAAPVPPPRAPACTRGRCRGRSPRQCAITHSWGSSAGWTILLGAAAGVATKSPCNWRPRWPHGDGSAGAPLSTPPPHPVRPRSGRRGARAELGVDVAQGGPPRSLRQLRTAPWRIIAISMTLYGFQVDMVKYTAARLPGNARV